MGRGGAAGGIVAAREMILGAPFLEPARGKLRRFAGEMEGWGAFEAAYWFCAPSVKRNTMTVVRTSEIKKRGCWCGFRFPVEA